MVEYNLGITNLYIDSSNGNYYYAKSISDVHNFDNLHPNEKIDICDSCYFYNCVNISINITKKCNLRCNYCFNKNKKNLNLDFLDILSNVKLFEERLFTLFGSINIL